MPADKICKQLGPRPGLANVEAVLDLNYWALFLYSRVFSLSIYFLTFSEKIIIYKKAMHRRQISMQTYTL